jgi:hypothetical protein
MDRRLLHAIGMYADEQEKNLDAVLDKTLSCAKINESVGDLSKQNDIRGNDVNTQS